MPSYLLWALAVAGSAVAAPAARSRGAVKLDFVQPFVAHNQAEFTLQPMPDGATEVRWRMHGPANFISKLMGVFMDTDKMVGRDFEDGLQNLRHIAEAPAS